VGGKYITCGYGEKKHTLKLDKRGNRPYVQRHEPWVGIHLPCLGIRGVNSSCAASHERRHEMETKSGREEEDQRREAGTVLNCGILDTSSRLTPGDNI
jgi:hypothetical protein